MNPKKTSLPLLKLLAITFFATSIVLLNFQNPGWEGNEKSYLGVLAGIICWVWDRKR